MKPFQGVENYQGRERIVPEEETKGTPRNQDKEDRRLDSLDRMEQAHDDIDAFSCNMNDYFDRLDREVESPEIRQEISSLRSKGKLLTAETLKKVSEQLGSNQGGWYEDQETKNRYYIKLYENPDQARVEFIANAVYERLGIGAARSQLLNMDGQLAIASEEIPGAESTYREDQRESSDVRDGFVADAYLANWDVVGLNYDNLVKGADGRIHRIDNGGALIFRAQGGQKEYIHNNIPELQSMLNPEYPSGRVFQGMTEEEMKLQAGRIVDNLHTFDIESILSRAGVEGSLREEIRAGLVGRRQFLIERFGLQETDLSTVRITSFLEKMLKEFENPEEAKIYPRIGFLADKEMVENQQVDIIYASKEKRYVVNFKLTAPNHDLVMAKIDELLQKGEVEAVSEPIYYDHKEGMRLHDLVDAYNINFNGLPVKISRGINSRRGATEIRSALGLVQIEIPIDGSLGESEINSKINEIFRNLLDIKEGLEAPDAEAEKRYKTARYSWHHKLEESPLGEEDIERRLNREEVFPGYWTMVEKGKHREYQDYSPHAIYSFVMNSRSIPDIIRIGGLISTHERYRRGFIVDGMSSDYDLRTGGADSVFTSTVTEAGLKHNKEESDSKIPDPWELSYSIGLKMSCFFIFEPDLFDRTDWYAYYADQYGSTDPNFFQDREAPRELFENQKNNGFNVGNEQMFRLGISIEKIKAIAVSNNDKRAALLEELYSSGISEINGKPIEDFVIIGSTYEDFIDISQGKKPRSQINIT